MAETPQGNLFRKLWTIVKCLASPIVIREMKTVKCSFLTLSSRGPRIRGPKEAYVDVEVRVYADL